MTSTSKKGAEWLCWLVQDSRGEIIELPSYKEAKDYAEKIIERAKVGTEIKIFQPVDIYKAKAKK